MIIKNVQKYNVNKETSVHDCYVGDSYIKHHRGSLADVDCDYMSTRRPEVKAYIERRYNHDNKQRVFSAGTFTTEKARSVIKDICRVHKIPIGTTNYITAIIDDDASWTDIMRIATKEKKVRDFIQKYPDVFEEILAIMNQPRSAGVHASALIVIPDTIDGRDVECFDVVPMRKMDDLLVSEIDGYSLDDMGILKNDVLAIAELSRLSDILDICNKEYNANIDMLKIITNHLNDPLVFEVLRKGLTQGVFQMSGDGITRFIKRLKPDNINDLIASVALFRPGPLDTGSAQAYIDCKNGLVEPEYLWGTYEIVGETYAQLIYQEQVSRIAQKIGGLSLGDGVNLVKALSKKKIEKVRIFKDKYFEGAKNNGCPKEAAERIWEIVEAGASYLFNKSHATAYGLTAYVGAWLKVHYPIAFYTVLLKWVDKEKLPTLMNEMREIGDAKIAQPDINISGNNFVTDFKTNTIYWSLSRIRQLGEKAVGYIMKERNLMGQFLSLEEFINRIFKYKLRQYQYWDDPDNPDEYERCPVTAMCVRNLIMSGAFDTLEGVKSIGERYGLLERAAEQLGFEIPEKEVPVELRDKHWFWSQQQITLSGIGSIDYKRIYLGAEKPNSVKALHYFELRKLTDEMLGENRVAICATIAEVSEKSYKDKRTGENKKYGKVILYQNTDSGTLILWSDSWMEARDYFMDRKGRIVIAAVNTKYSDYDETNILQLNKGAFVMNV